MIKAVFFDLDGTLYSHKTGRVPPSTWEAIDTLGSKGIRCLLATGRSMGEIHRLLGHDLPFHGYVTLNGQLVADAQGGILWDNPIEGQMKENLVRMFTEKTLPLLLIEADGMYVNLVDRRVLKVQENISTPVPRIAPYSGNPIYQAVAYASREELPVLQAAFPECGITWFDNGGADIIAGGGGKVPGIRRYLEMSGIRQEEIMAFGDGQNDAEMLRFAAVGVSLGNGSLEALEAADYITADIDDDGVAKALAHFQLI